MACSLCLVSISAYVPGLQPWAVRLVQQINFESLILHGMLALLRFAGAFLFDLKFLIREKLVVTALSVAGTLSSTALVAALMRLGSCRSLASRLRVPMPVLWSTDFAHRSDCCSRNAPACGRPEECASSTGWRATLQRWHCAVVFLALLDASRGAIPSAMNLGVFLLLKAGGGLTLGVLTAWITSSLMRLVDAYQVEILLTLSLALGGYALADTWHLSAPLEAVTAALALRRFNLNHLPAQIAHESIDGFWEVIDEVQNAVLFVLLGLEVLAIPFYQVSLESGLAAISLSPPLAALWLDPRMHPPLSA